MIRWLIGVGVIGTLVVGWFVFVARPEVLEQQISKVEAPIKHAIAEHRDARIQAEKDQAWAAWQRRYPPAPDCISPATAIKRLECKNASDMSASRFEQNWRQRLASERGS
jgi:hypothetical protein